MKKVDLFAPVRIGDLDLPNRIVMSPMTRSRAGEGGTPTRMNAEYYAQRASAGLVITEGTQPSPTGQGYPRTPGIYSPEQIAGWKQVTDAVHEKGGQMILQIMHCGRISHPLNQPSGAEIVGPSAVRAKVEMFTETGMVDVVEPRALALDEIPSVIEEFRQATDNAFKAGFSGVELHAASGYLPMQFLSPNANVRTDRYGGSVANRVRFVVEVLEAMASVRGPGRVGLKVAPGFTFNDVHDDDPRTTYTELAKQVNTLRLAYLHVQLPPKFLDAMAEGTDKSIDPIDLMRPHFDGPMLAAGDFTLESGMAAVRSGQLQLVAFGRAFLANPDLPERYRKGSPLNEVHFETFYSPGPKGYIDYPTLAEITSQ